MAKDLKKSKVLISVGILGSTGRMGQSILKIIEEDFNSEMKVDLEIHSHSQVDFESLSKLDVIIDVSLPKACEGLLKGMLGHVQKQKNSNKKTNSESAVKKIPAIVIGSTGWFKSGQDVIFNYGKYAPVLVSANFSPGITLFSKFLEEYAPKFKKLGYEVAVSEVHHNKKRDFPSGTAKMFIEKLESVGLNAQVNFIRAGSVIGKHSVEFFGPEEIFKVSHEALNRDIFARGAILAASWIVNRRKRDEGLVGYYNMSDIFFS